MTNNIEDLSDKVLFHVTVTGQLAVTYYTNDQSVYSHYTYPSNKEGAEECLKRIAREKKTSLVFTEEFISETSKCFNSAMKKFAINKAL